MIALNLPHLPRPAAVELMIARQFPARVLEAERQATNAANKILGAFNPGLIVRIGGES